MAIGAWRNDGNGSGSGHVRVFKLNGSVWTQRGLDIDGETQIDRSESSVSLSSDGTVMAIGAPFNDGNGDISGHVRVFKWNGNVWNQRGLEIDGEAAEDHSGSSVSLSLDASVVAIGAVGNDGNGDSSGHVRVFKWNGNQWIQRGLDIDGDAGLTVNCESIGDGSGRSVSLSSDGTVMAIGADENDGNGKNSSGHVRLYKWNGSVWTQRRLDIDGEAQIDQSGFSVSLSSDGTVVAIGAWRNDGNGSDSGHVRVFTFGKFTVIIER